MYHIRCHCTEPFSILVVWLHRDCTALREPAQFLDISPRPAGLWFMGLNGRFDFSCSTK